MKVSEFKGKTITSITTDGHIWFIRFADGDTCMFSHKLDDTPPFYTSAGGRVEDDIERMTTMDLFKSLVPGHFDKEVEDNIWMADNDN